MTSYDTFFVVNKSPLVLVPLICEYLYYYNIEYSYRDNYFNCKYEYNNSIINFYIHVDTNITTGYNTIIKFIKYKCNDITLYYHLYNEMKRSLITQGRIQSIQKPPGLEESNLNIIIEKVSSKNPLVKLNGLIELSKYSIDNSEQLLQVDNLLRLLYECLNYYSCNITIIKHTIIILANLVNKSERVKKYLIHSDIFGLDSKLRMSPHKCIVDEYVNLLGNLIF